MKIKQLIEFLSSLQEKFIETAEIKIGYECGCMGHDCCAESHPRDIDTISVSPTTEWDRDMDGNQTKIVDANIYLLLSSGEPGGLDWGMNDRKLVADEGRNRDEIIKENKRRMGVSKVYKEAFGDSY